MMKIDNWKMKWKLISKRNSVKKLTVATMVVILRTKTVVTQK